MRSFPAICWWALAIVLFTESVKSTSNTDVDETNHRLPNETYPEHYNIELTTNVHLGDKTFEGEVTIDIVVVNSTSKIVLHAGPLAVSKATIENPLTGESEDLSVEHELNREMLTLTRSSEKFSPQTKWKLTIIYRGHLSDNSVGFFITNYEGDDGKYHHLAATLFRPSFARHAFPCYDEVNKLANFTITINHSPTYTAISNMPVNAKLSSANRTVFLTTPPMATYHVAFTVSDFEYTEDKHNNFPLRVYSRPNTKNFHNKILSIISQFVKTVFFYIDVPYMLPKMDIVIIPNNEVVNMESLGLLMFIESTFIPELITFDLTDTSDTLLEIGKTIAAQLINNYVTISSFSYIWLTEAIKELYALNAIAYMYPEWNVWDINDNSWYSKTLDIDSDDQSLLLPHYENKTPLEMMESMSSELCVKIMHIMRMWNNALTDKVYRKGLNKFLQKNQYRLVGEQELFNALQFAVEEENYEIPATINEMISTWTNQKGYPILTVSRNYNDSTFIIKQETFYKNEIMKDSKTWYVPINYAVASSFNFYDTKVTHYLRNVPETNFSDVEISNDDWLILNKQSIGYYRVNYDITNWNLIIKSLIENPFQIHNHNRAQLLRDAIALWKSNRLDVSVLLNLFTYLKKENDFLCWNTFVEFFTEVNDFLVTNEKYDDFQSFVAEQVNPIYEKLRLVNKSNDNYFQSIIRSDIEDLTEYVNVNKLVENDYNNLKNHLKENKILTEDVLYCNVMEIADDEIFNTLYQMLIDKENKNSKNLLIDALGCNRNINLFKKLLRSSIDNSIFLENEYRHYILQTTCYNRYMNYVACIEFLNKNFKAVANLKSLDKNYLPLLEYMIYNLALKMHNNGQEDSLLALLNKVKKEFRLRPDLKILVKNAITLNDKYSKKCNELLTGVAEYRERAMQVIWKVFQKSEFHHCRYVSANV